VTGISQIREARRKAASGNRGGGGSTKNMTKKDASRKWMWWFLGTVVALQLYFVRELIAAFALFALVFGLIAFIAGGLYMLQKSWEVAVQRVANSSHPVVNVVRRGAEAVEDLVRRPLRGPRSAAAR